MLWHWGFSSVVIDCDILKRDDLFGVVSGRGRNPLDRRCSWTLKSSLRVSTIASMHVGSFAIGF